MQNHNESLIDILALLYKKRRVIIMVCLATAILSSGASLLLPNYFKASTQFYAASPDLAQPSPLGNLSDQKRIYGNDNDIDRLLSISKSNEVKNFMIDSFKLFEHYRVSPDETNARHKVMERLEKLYNTEKTKYDAVELSVEDTDPGLAAHMANAVRMKVDSIARSLIKESQARLIRANEESIKEKQQQYDEIADSLYAIRKRYNIFNTQSQGEAFGSSIVELEGSIESYSARVRMLKGNPSVPKDSIAIAEAKLSGFRNQYANLKKNIQSYNDGYPKVLRYERELKDFGDQLNLDKERLKQLKAAFNSEISAIHVVEHAEIPEYKSRPKRSYMVAAALILSLAFMSVWLILLEQFRREKWSERFKDV